MTSGASPGGWPSNAGIPPTTAPPTAEPAALGPVYGQPYPGVPAHPVGAPYPVSQVPFPASAPPLSAIPYGQWAPGQWAPGQWAPGQWPGVVAPPAPSRRWVHQLVRALAALVILLSGGGFIAFEQYAGGPSATWVKGALQADPPPGPFESDQAWADWARRSVSQAIEQQAKALLAGDERTFLAPADPDNAELLANLSRRYEVLRAMGPGVWIQAIMGELKSVEGRRWRASIRTSYCFGASGCRTSRLVADSEWAAKDNRVVLIKLAATDEDSYGPRPWENDALVVQSGERVVIGTSKFAQSRLPDDLVGVADRAAKVADMFGKWETPPSKYVIFFAGPSEWGKWYGGDLPDWVAGFAIELNDVVREVAILANHRYRDQDGLLEFLLVHELTHVSSLAGKGTGAVRRNWWLSEGLADYAAMLKIKVSDYDGLTPTGSYVRGRWDGDPAVTPPSASSSDEEAAARYGIAFLAVRGIAEKYGQDKMLDFFGRVVHYGDTYDVAAQRSFGTSWSTVRSAATSFIRASVD